MKKCSDCKVTKTLTEFYKKTDRKSGYSAICKSCEKLKGRERYVKNKDKKLAANRTWQRNNPDKMKEMKSRYRNKESTKQQMLKYNRNWNDKNREKKNQREASRRAAKLRATPPWLTETMKTDMEIKYLIAISCTKASQDISINKAKYEVDHIIPLQSKVVCGLHVPWNLQILTKANNIKKSNKLQRSF